MRLQMSVRHWTPIALVLGCLTPALLLAQSLDPSNAQATPKNAVGGKFSFDLIYTRLDSLGVTLRHGGIIPGSEEVSLDDRKLVAGQDYTIDDASGVVYLLVPSRPNQSVSVSYRYDPTQAQTGAAVQSNSLVPFRMDFGSMGSMGFTFGMGLADREANGAVTTSNVFGWNNSFNLGGMSSLSGLALVGQKQQQTAFSNFEAQAQNAAPDVGNSHLIMQSLASKLGGGAVKLDYQDVSQNFSGFGAVTGNGYDASVANQLEKEKGLRRMDFSMDKVQLGSLGLTESYKTVGDEKGGITWQNYGLTSGGLTFNYMTQTVGQSFDRFSDLAETNRAQLANEAGLARRAMDATWKLGLSNLTYDNSSIDDTTGKGIDKQDLKLASPKFNLDYGSQMVNASFTRFSSLNDAAAPQWAKEGGLTRKWLTFDTTAMGGSTPLKFSQYFIESPKGGMKNMDASDSGKTWSFEHIQRQVDSGFTALPNLTQQEINDNIGAITNMYVQGGMKVTPDMQPNYMLSPGVNRDFTRLTLNPTPKLKLGFDALKLQGALDGKNNSGALNDVTLNGGGISLSYRREMMGTNFTALNSLMPFEQQRLGTMMGLNRTDLTFNADMRKNGKLSMTQTVASVPTGGMKRQALNYTDKTMQLVVNSRKVGPNFTTVGQLLDPEAGVLAQMIGYNETDAMLKWQATPALRIEADTLNGFDPMVGQKENKSNMLVQFGPNKATQFEFQRSSSDSNNPFDNLLANLLQRLSLTENFGKDGTLHYQAMEENYDLTQSTQPDAKQSDLSYETKLNSTTSLKAEQTSTSYDNGTTQQIQTSTVSTQITKQAGLSFTNMNIDNPGTTPDERKNNVGFWVDLWKGVRLNYGVNDDIDNLAGTTTTQHTLSMTPGTVGDLAIGSMAYMANTWEQGNRTQATSNISLSTVKPFAFGPLKNLKLSMGQDTAADSGAWLKENKNFGFSGSLGKNTFGYNFLSQMNSLQQRGVDRAFTFTTDQSDKSPLRANLMYKFRTLPGDKDIAIRNFSITAKPVKGMELTNELLTNPEIPAGDQLLGTLPQPTRVNKWKLDYLGNPNFKIEGSWQEQRDDSTNAISRLGGMTFTMFEKSGSPVSLFMGLEQAGGNIPYTNAERWSLRWDQRPGPNQAMSIFVGNVNYGGLLENGQFQHNLSADIEYQWKFWSSKPRKKDDTAAAPASTPAPAPANDMPTPAAAPSKP